MNKDYSIVEYPFDDRLETELLDKERDYLSWPVVYFLQNSLIREAYVGETTDMVSRMKSHLKTPKKQRLSKVSLIRSDLFNKSATLDIEANLIRYIAADGAYTLQNGNLGISNHTFFQKRDVYWNLFRELWQELQTLGIARHSLDYIDNSDLFKYSPYKSLSREQTNGLRLILECLLDPGAEVSLIHGGAGTGKSILAIFLFKLLKTDLSDFNRADFEEQDDVLFDLVERVRERFGHLEMGLVIPMQSFRKTISKVFKNIKGLSAKMVIGPSDVAKRHYDLLIVDEGHRLRQWRNLAAYYGTFRKVSHALGFDEYNCSELDWILKQSDKSVIFYDQGQSIKPSDTGAKVFVDLESKPTTRVERLSGQFRVRGGEAYIAHVENIFSDHLTADVQPFNRAGYDCRLFTDLGAMIDLLRKKEQEVGLCRLVAGFAWEWISKRDKTRKDIVIGDVELQWNSTDVDWVNSPNAINELGCIHTTQGYDLNYTGVIIGPELDYDFDSKSFIVYKDRYKDKNGKHTIKDPEVLKKYILNIYRTMLFRGIKGTFIFACNPDLQKYLSRYIQTDSLVAMKKTARIFNDPGPKRIPLYDLKFSEGSFSDPKMKETVKFIQVDRRFSNPNQYFACQFIGGSMDKVIPDGAYCLFEKYEGGPRNGLICLVESDNFLDPDFKAHYMIREYTSKKTVTKDGWKHQEIVLFPRSYSTEYEPIILRNEETIDLRVIGVFLKVL